LEETGEWPDLGALGNFKEIVKSSGDTVGEEPRLGSSGDEDVVIREVIVARGASSKTKNAAHPRKTKLLILEERRGNDCDQSRW